MNDGHNVLCCMVLPQFPISCVMALPFFITLPIPFQSTLKLHPPSPSFVSRLILLTAVSVTHLLSVSVSGGPSGATTGISVAPVQLKLPTVSAPSTLQSMLEQLAARLGNGTAGANAAGRPKTTSGTFPNGQRAQVDQTSDSSDLVFPPEELRESGGGGR